MDKVLRTFFEARPEVRFAYLFGSQARGQATHLSDIDVAVVLEGGVPVDALDLQTMASDLVATLGVSDDDLDLVDLRGASLLFIFQVLRDGRCVFQRDERERVAFETRALMQHYDFLPFQEQYNRAQRARLRRASA